MTGFTPSIAFLGFCERAAYVRDGNTNLFKWNILGLKHIILSHLFPLNLDGWNIGIAFLFTGSGKPIVISITDSTGAEVGKIEFLAEASMPGVEETALRSDGIHLLMAQHGWTTVFLPIRNGGIVINQPGVYFLKLLTDEGPHIMGQVHFAVIDPQPLTPERIAAIRSDPAAIKSVRIDLGCRKCPAKLRIYAGLERLPKSEEEGYMWYETIPDVFNCDCGSTTIDLRILRRNLFAPVGQSMGETAQLSFIPMYEYSAVESIRHTFANLLVTKAREEVLQKFIEENPIILHQFPAEKIFFKPPILTFFNADFAIVTPQKELIFIEIEKAITRLMRKDGGATAELQHAFDQVHGWLHVVDEHRLAVLDSLKIDRSLVSSIRGVVIAGRDLGYDAQHLRRLKGIDRGRVTFLTYDDLLFGLIALLHRMKSL
jgi:Domain of unknown function (DUF4263)